MRESGKIGAVLLASALVCLAAPRRASWAEAAETTAPLSSATSPALSLADEGSSLAIDAEEESPVAHWRLLEPSNPPPPRLGALMVYATDRQRTLLFGGFLENGEYCNETWEYDGRTWKQLDIASPPANPAYTLAYDSHRGVAVLYGGRGRETWEFGGEQWKRARCEHRPPITGFGAMAYDSNRRLVVLFGGETEETSDSRLSGLSGETWQYDAYDWVRVEVGRGPSPRKYHRMVYDSARERFVVFGGFDGVALNDTWELRAAGWRRVETREAPSPRRGFALTYDPVGQRTLLFGGFPGGEELWSFDGAEWSQIMATRAPPFREGAGLVFVPTTRRVLLFGGLSTRLLNDSWELIRATTQPPLQMPPRSEDLTVPEDRAILPWLAPDEPPLPPGDEPLPGGKESASDRAEARAALAELHFEGVELEPRVLMPNRAVSLSGLLVNSGKADATCWIEFWLSKSRDPFTRFRLLCRSARVEVKSGQSYNLGRLFRILGTDLPSGRFYVGLEVDRVGKVAEQDETNNLYVIAEPYTID